MQGMMVGSLAATIQDSSSWAELQKITTWTIKKTERWRTDAFKLSCWRRLFRVPWTARRSNQSNLKEINPVYSLEGLMRKLKLQYFGHLMWRTDSLEKILMPGKTEGRRREWQRMRWVDGIVDSWTWVCANSGRSWRTGKPATLQSIGLQRVGHAQSLTPHFTDVQTEAQRSYRFGFWVLLFMTKKTPTSLSPSVSHHEKKKKIIPCASI